MLLETSIKTRGSKAPNAIFRVEALFLALGAIGGHSGPTHAANRSRCEIEIRPPDRTNGAAETGRDTHARSPQIF